MARQDVEFKTSDGVTLRGWFYKPSSHPSTASSSSSTASSSKHPCLIMLHGFSAVKEQSLDYFAEQFISAIPSLCVLVYDNRGFGASDTLSGQPRQEIIPAVQCSDLQDAITYVGTRDEVNPERVGVWGSSFAGGHVLAVAAGDKRVKAVISQVPLISGYETMQRLIRPDFMGQITSMVAADRAARYAGHAPAMIPVVDENPMAQSALPTADSYAFFNSWASKAPAWKNEVTVRTIEALRAYNPGDRIDCISPTPLLMVVQDRDVLCPLDIALRAYARALEPKELCVLQGGHFEAYKSPNVDVSVARQVEFLKKSICA